jgi:hypothetical protein
MKKNILLIAAMITAGATFAQDLTSKKGTPILPESGDYAIGFDAANLVNYAGNLFNGAAGNSAGNLNLMNTNTIYGKYFVDANTAYRGMVRLGFGTTTNRTVVADLSAGAAAGSTVEDEVKNNNLNITLGGGIEMRRGKGRLQGVYGPMAMISLGSNSTENTYGNSLQDEFNANGTTSRTTETKSGSSFGLALGGFAGVEYFFAPKISVGAEIAWTIQLNSQANGETTTENWNAGTSSASSTTTETGGSSSFGLDTRPNGVISLNFHF